MTRRLGFSLLLALAVLLWVAFVVVGYYYVHKPFTPGHILPLSKALGQFLASAAIVSLAGGLGLWLSPAPGLPAPARPVVQAALGLGLLSVGVLLVGATLGLRGYLAWGTLLLASLLLRRRILAWWRSWGETPWAWRSAGRLEKLLLGLTAFILLAGLTLALSPPLAFDALTYHLALPRSYLTLGRLVYLPENIYWGMPQVTEMLYTWAMVLAGPEAAATLGWMTGALTLAGLWGYAAHSLGRRAAALAMAALTAGATLAMSLAWAYVEWPLMLCALGGLIWLDRWRQTGQRGDLVVTAIFAGLALGVKYTGGVLLLAALGSVLAQDWRRPKRALANAFWMGGLASLVSLPWWLKNVLATGNPFYPFLYPAGSMDALRLALYQGLPPTNAWQDVWLLPLRATLWGLEGAPGYGVSLGPLLLAFAVWVWIGWPQRSAAARATLTTAAQITLLGLAIWIVAGRFSGWLIQTRMYVSIFPAAALLAGGGFTALERISLPGVRLGRVAGVLIALVMVFNAAEIGVDLLNRGSLLHLVGLRSDDQYLSDNLGWYLPAMQAIRSLPEHSKVVMLWETRSFYCLPLCHPDEINDRWRRELVQHGRPMAVRQSLLEQGYTHLLFFRLGADFIRQDDRSYSPSEWQALDEFLASLPPPQRLGGYELYRLQP